MKLICENGEEKNELLRFANKHIIHKVVMAIINAQRKSEQSVLDIGIR